MAESIKDPEKEGGFQIKGRKTAGISALSMV